MKRFDFSQTGGFPLTQDRLAWMQESYTEAIHALAGACGSTSPVVVAGVELLTGSWGSGGTVSDGWIWHPSDGLMPFVGGTFAPSFQGVIYQDVTTPLTFANNSVQNVQIKRVAKIGPGTLPAVHDLSVNRWAAALGRNNRTAWQSLNGGVGDVNVQMKYCYDKITNMAHLNGLINVQLGVAPATPYLSLLALPSIISPSRIIPFAAATSYTGAQGLFTLPVDSNGLEFSQDNGYISASPGVAAVLCFRVRKTQIRAPQTYIARFDFNYLVH